MDTPEQIQTHLDTELSALCRASGLDLEEAQDYALTVALTDAEGAPACIAIDLRPARGAGESYVELVLELRPPAAPGRGWVALIRRLDVFAFGAYDPLATFDAALLTTLHQAFEALGFESLAVDLEGLDASHLWYTTGATRPPPADPRAPDYWERLGFLQAPRAAADGPPARPAPYLVRRCAPPVPALARGPRLP